MYGKLTGSKKRKEKPDKLEIFNPEGNRFKQNFSCSSSDCVHWCVQGSCF